MYNWSLRKRKAIKWSKENTWGSNGQTFLKTAMSPSRLQAKWKQGILSFTTLAAHRASDKVRSHSGFTTNAYLYIQYTK